MSLKSLRLIAWAVLVALVVAAATGLIRGAG
jgi:hypothetical protein